MDQVSRGHVTTSSIQKDFSSTNQLTTVSEIELIKLCRIEILRLDPISVNELPAEAFALLFIDFIWLDLVDNEKLEDVLCRLVVEANSEKINFAADETLGQVDAH